MRKPIIDTGTRLVVDAPLVPPIPPRAKGDARPAHVELIARSTFSGVAITGAVCGPTLAHAARAWPGSGLPEEIADRMGAFCADVFSLTDVDTVAGVVRAFARAKELRMRFIPGVELWLDEGPLVLHAATSEGWANLCAILTESRGGLLDRGLVKGEIAHDLARVCAKNAGLFATILPPFHDDGVAPLVAAFGDRLSIAVYMHMTPEDAPRTAWARAHAARHGIALLATARAFLVDRADKRFHDVLTCIRQGLTIDDAGQRILPNGQARLRSSEEMCALFADLPDAIARSRAIADACTFELGQLKYAFPASEHGVDPHARLTRVVFEGALVRYGTDDIKKLPADVQAQLEHELRLIEELDVAEYFLTVFDIVSLAREKGILCQGRGSAANSVVCFCLGVTSIDPVRMGLLFERFLSAERGEPPDIDVDFEHERREEVIQAIYERWGRDHAGMVANVIAFRGRSAVREVGKVFGLTETITAKIAGLMWQMHGSMRDVTEARLAEAGVDASARLVERTLTFAERIQGHPRHLGIHVGGFVLTAAPIQTLAPVEPARMEARTVLPFDKDDVDALKLFKMDVLGLGILTCIRKGLALIDEHHGEHFELHTIPPEDPRVYEALGRADAIGVFQVESRAQMAMLPRMRPSSFYDLVVEVAIIRPGPIQGGMVHPYLRRREGLDPVEYPHPSLRPILERTLGVPLFQEQVMKIAIVGAGYTAGEADQLRRDMAAWRKTGKLMRHKEKLIRGFVDHGIEREFAERLFEQMKGFGEYGFPESHAASFAILVYASAWLKTHHPAIFACALLNSLPMGFYSPSQIVADLQAHGGEVRPVRVDESDWDSTLERDRAGGPLVLRLGLRLVKGLSFDEAMRVTDARRERAFRDVSDVFARAALTMKAQDVLARAGALDGLTTHRRAAVWRAMHKEAPLFRAVSDDAGGRAFPVPNARDVIELDYASTGLSVDDHPMAHLRASLESEERRRGRRLVSARDVQERVPHKTRIVTAGLVIGRQRPGTADGTCFVTLEDETGLVNVVVWGRDFEAWRLAIVTSSFLRVTGRVEREGIVVHLIADGVEKILASADDEPFPYRSRDFH